MKRFTLKNDIRQPGKMVELDFQNPVHREWFLSLYGGEENLRQRLPALNAAYQQTCREPPPPLVTTGGDFCAGASVDCVCWTREGNHLCVQAVTSLPDLAFFVDEYLEIRTAAGECVDGYAQSTADTYHTTLTLETDFDPEKFKSDILEVDYTITWANAATGELRAFMSSRDVHRQVLLNSTVKEIHLLDPIKKRGSAFPINIAYNRNFIPSDQVDYMYQEKFNYSTGKQKLYAPLSAWVEFVPGTPTKELEEFDEIDTTTFLLKMDCGRGVAYYTKTGRETSIQQHFFAKPNGKNGDTNGFYFALEPDWMDDVPAGRWPIRDRVDLNFSVDFKLKSGGRGNIQIGSCLPASAAQDSGALKCGWFNLIWGCLAAGTRILMADGSQKVIETIEVGEEIQMDAEGRVARVVSTASGNEPHDMVTIETLGGRRLVCTQDHPVITEKGPLRASDIHGDCRLITSTGAYVGIIGIWASPGTAIYNLELCPEEQREPPASGCTMFAEDILVGDNTMQGGMGQAREEPPRENPHRAEADCKRALWEAMR